MPENKESVIARLIKLPFILIIKAYKLIVSPWLGTACRYTPTCSEYSKEAIIQHGIVKGVYLSMMRIIKCNPWGGHGEDPVPKNHHKHH